MQWVVDHHLPGLSGAELIVLVRGAARPKPQSLPIVGLAGRAGSERVLMDAGASCFIHKPFSETDLSKAVRWALDVYGPTPVS